MKMLKTAFFALAAMFMVAEGSFAQEINRLPLNSLRRLTLQSDVILASSRRTAIQEYVNDYSQAQYYVINRIDRLITDKTSFKTGDSIKIQHPIDDFPYYWNDTEMSFKEVAVIEEIDLETRYTDLFFLKKDGGRYKLLGITESIKWNDLEIYYIPAIRQIEKIEKATTLDERYAQTIDWYIAYNDYPDDIFIQFYKHKKVIGDTLLLSVEQQQKAKKAFLSGKEELLPFVKDHFPVEVKTYWLDQLRKIRRKNNLEYDDYYDFRRTIRNIFTFEYNSIDSILLDILYENSVSKYRKKDTMDYFIRMVEECIKQDKLAAQ